MYPEIGIGSATVDEGFADNIRAHSTDGWSLSDYRMPFPEEADTRTALTVVGKSILPPPSLFLFSIDICLTAKKWVRHTPEVGFSLAKKNWWYKRLVETSKTQTAVTVRSKPLKRDRWSMVKLISGSGRFRCSISDHSRLLSTSTVDCKMLQ